MLGLLRTPAATGLGADAIPTLVMWGERDQVFPRAEQDALLDAIPHAVLRTFSEIGHAPHWEEPERFASELLAFLADS